MFTPTEMFSQLIDIPEIPAGFCGDTVDTAQAAWNQAQKDYDASSAFGEWLKK